MESSELPESIFDDKYEILGQLGSGGLGTVYRAKQIDFGRTVALKILHNKFAVDDDFKTRFLREAKVLNQLKHPNIVQIFHLGVAATGQPYLAMELIEGKNCKKLLYEQNRLPTLLALKIVRDTALALKYVHENGIVHRDLKPENILVLNEPEPNTVKLIDFGLVRLLDNSESNQKLTQTGELVGTAAYMSPEQCKGQKADLRADIYSLGICLFELLTGEKCYTADTDVGMLYKHATEAPPTVKASMVERYVPSLDKLISKSMQKEPAMRFQSMQEMASAIDAVIEEIEQVGTRSPRLPNNAVVPISIISAVALLVLAGFGFKAYRNASNKSVINTLITKKKKVSPAAETIHLPMKGEEMENLIFTYNKENGPEAGISIAKKWLKLHERDAQREDKDLVYTALTGTYASQHKNKEMEFYASKVLEDKDALSQSIEVTKYLSRCYLAELKPQKALDTIQKTLDSYPSFANCPPRELVILQSDTLMRLGKYEEAIGKLEKLESNYKTENSQEYESSLPWRLALMTAYKEVNQNIKLKKLIDESIAIGKMHEQDSPTLLANIYLHASQTVWTADSNNEKPVLYAKLAIPLFLKAHLEDSAAFAEFTVGSTLMKRGSYAEALAVFQRIAETYKQSFDSKAENLVNMYGCARHLSDSPLAKQYLEQAMQCLTNEYKTDNPNSFNSHQSTYCKCVSLLADLFIENQEFVKAGQWLDQWVLDPSQNKFREQFYTILAAKKCEVLIKLRRYDEALKCIDDSQTLLNDGSSKEPGAEYDHIDAVITTHMWKSIVLSLINDSESSRRETNWIVHYIKSNDLIKPEDKVSEFLRMVKTFESCNCKIQANIMCDEAEGVLLKATPVIGQNYIGKYLEIAEIRASSYQNSRAESMFRNCISRLNALGQSRSELMMRAKFGLGNMLKRQSKYKEAEAATTESLNLAKQLNTQTDIFWMGHRILWEIYFSTGEYKKAKQEAQLSRKGAPINLELMFYCGEAVTCIHLKELTEAKQLLDAALERAKQLHQPEYESYALETYALLSIENKQYKEALAQLDKAIELSNHAPKNDEGIGKAYLAEAYHSKGIVLAKLNRKAEAIECLKKAKGIFDSMDYDSNEAKMHIANLLEELSKNEGGKIKE